MATIEQVEQEEARCRTILTALEKVGGAGSYLHSCITDHLQQHDAALNATDPEVLDRYYKKMTIFQWRE